MKDRISGCCPGKWNCGNGPDQSRRRSRMEGAEEPLRYPQISRVLQLLSPVYQRVLKDSKTTERSSQERGQMGLGKS